MSDERTYPAGVTWLSGTPTSPWMMPMPRARGAGGRWQRHARTRSTRGRADGWRHVSILGVHDCVCGSRGDGWAVGLANLPSDSRHSLGKSDTGKNSAC
jgi:hypothetical protein